jgi:acetylornithine deacetylase/succinyl-diaminopimelate desuccinylase-like protein
VSGIALNNCKICGRPSRHWLFFRLAPRGGTLAAHFICAYCPVVEFGLVSATTHMMDEHVVVAEIEALTEMYAVISEVYVN